MDYLLEKDNFDCLKDKHSEKRNMEFPNWFIKKLIGKGAYAKVYLITHEDEDKIRSDYALKVYKKELLIEHEMQESIFRERDALLELDHPFILNLKCSF